MSMGIFLFARFSGLPPFLRPRESWASSISLNFLLISGISFIVSEEINANFQGTPSFFSPNSNSSGGVVTTNQAAENATEISLDAIIMDLSIPPEVTANSNSFKSTEANVLPLA